MLALGHIDSEWKSLELRYAARVFEFTQKEIQRIGRLVREGLDTADLLGKNADTLFGFKRQLRNELLNIMTQAGNFGRRQVNDELERQK